MRRTDFNCPIESGGILGTSRGTFAESPLAAREVTRCFRWDEERALGGLDGEPEIYFPFSSDWQESTVGSGVFVPTGEASIVANKARFGNTSGGANAARSSLSNVLFDLFTGASFTLRCRLGWDHPSTSLADVTRILYKGDPATYGFHVVNEELPETGWSIEYYSSGADFYLLQLCIGGPGGTLILLNDALGSFDPFRTKSNYHVVITYDADTQEINTWGNNYKRTLDVSGNTFVLNSDPLNLSDENQIWSGTPGPAGPTGARQTFVSQLGIWDYPWDDEQVACDYANAYTWP